MARKRIEMKPVLKRDAENCAAVFGKNPAKTKI